MATTPHSPARSSERAFLVSVFFTGRARDRAVRRMAAAAARDAALLHAPEGTAAEHRQPDEDARQQEFRDLVESAHATIVGELTQHRERPDPATLVGSGKVDEIAGAASATEADLVLIDHDLSPTQLRNLEAALPCPVVDRTQLILDIFARHARTREGQLQVELAQLEYMLPRLTGRGRAMSQLGGGIGTRGPGETQLETDRRRIARRLVQLKREIDGVRRVRAQQRQRRETAPTPTVALVGYTNAGKSTLFNRLTDAGVLASSRMFATLDPKLKPIQLPSRRRVVLSDTVGFIRDLPHTLVTSFRATLEEVERAEVLLHVQDAASPDRDVHKAEVEKVLAELGALDKPRVEVLNKVDLLAPEEREALERQAGVQRLPLADRGASPAAVPRILPVSAREGLGVEQLLAAIDGALTVDPLEEAVLLIPQSAGEVLATLDSETTVRARTYEGDGVRIEVTAPRSLLGRLRSYRA